MFHYSIASDLRELAYTLRGGTFLLPFADFLDPVFQLITLEENDEHRLVHVVALGPKPKTKTSDL